MVHGTDFGQLGRTAGYVSYTAPAQLEVWTVLDAFPTICGSRERRAAACASLRALRSSGDGRAKAVAARASVNSVLNNMVTVSGGRES
jgi:hypothetical protein